MPIIICQADARRMPLADASVDAIVCDPPYGLEFMGREWDSFRTGNGFRRAANPADVERDSVFGRTSRTSPEYLTGKPSNARIRTRVDGRTNPTEGKSTTSTPEAYVAGPPFEEFSRQWAAEAYRALKPGGYLLAFGGTRTWHRLTCGIEAAGFEVRDTITWLYGSGFPKSLDVGKAIDKAAGAEREVVGQDPWGPNRKPRPQVGTVAHGDISAHPGVTAPATDDARRWHGWGTALKPASEPIVVARKPLAGTVAANVLAYGTGALNIAACKVAGIVPATTRGGHPDAHNVADSHPDARNLGRLRAMGRVEGHDGGRWPANVVLSHVMAWDGSDACAGPDGCVTGCPVAELDRQSGVLTSGANPTRRGSDKFRDAYGEFTGQAECTPARGVDSGGASRFFPTFRYSAKAPSSERPKVDGVSHPTVKPLTLMRWLVKLVTPPGGTVLDPFAGSGTTLEAALLEGFDAIGYDLEPTHLPLVLKRVKRSTGIAVDVPLFEVR